MALAAMSVATRFSPFSNSLFAPSPPTLPQIPTLAELQKHAQAMMEGIAWPGKTAVAAPYNSKYPESAHAGNGGANGNGVMGTSWFSGIMNESPPPSYAPSDPLRDKAEAEAGKRGGGGAKLKKGRTGWRRLNLQEGLPSEAPPVKSKNKKSPFKAIRLGNGDPYARMEEARQPKVGDVQQDKEVTWWEW